MKIKNLYSGIMKEFGAVEDQVIDAEYNAAYKTYRIPEGVEPRQSVGKGDDKINLKDWFEKDPDGGWKMISSGEQGIDPQQYDNPRTSILPKAEKWKRENDWVKAHFYPQNGPGGRSLRNIKNNSGIGGKLADMENGARNSAKGLIGSLDNAHGLLPNISGSIDESEIGAYREFYDRINETFGDEKSLSTPLDNFKSPEDFKVAKHPIPKNKNPNFVTGRDGNPLPGNERGFKTLLEGYNNSNPKVGMLDNDPLRGELSKIKGKPKTLLPGGGVRNIKTGVGLGAKSLDAAHTVGRLARTGAAGLAYSAPGLLVDMVDPEANQRGRDIVGLSEYTFGDGRQEYAQGTPEWRLENLESAGRFLADTFIDTPLSLLGYGSGLLSKRKEAIAGNNKTNARGRKKR